MLNLTLLRKSYLQSRWLWLACASVLLVFCWVHVGITSQVDMGRFESILGMLPESWQKFSPVPFAELLSYEARIALIFEEPLVYLLMVIWCVARASDVVSGEIDRGTMELLLAQPVHRAQIIVCSVVISLLGVLGLALVAWAGLSLGIATTSIERPAEGASWTIPFTLIELSAEDGELQRVPMRRLVDGAQFFPAVVNYFCLGCFLVGVGTWLSSLDRHRWRTIGILVGFYVLSMLAEIVGQAFPSLAPVRHLSFHSLYEPIQAVVRDGAGDAWWGRNGDGQVVGLGPLAANLVLLTCGTGALAAALRCFCRRDVPAPI